ncbi:hypothetical protein [Myroides guanonis]|uniref:Uncharacterized protein n=1 Tax=Myroides guanonis TaxID=1150112 RepID=A0A1I3PMC5_9FLAO|nr:hypothetical protein [Myroides guanonis]SFJ22461.1 hypothetical protein SAMN04487893_104177 [Myroides guanonis]
MFRKNTVKIERFIKVLNNTELGLGNTKETYIHIRKEIDIDFMFIGYSDQFKSKTDSTESYPLKLTKNREIRIVGLGTYYRKYGLEGGDVIILERVEDNGKTSFFISHVKKVDTITLSKVGNKGFEILTKNSTIEKHKLSSVCKYNGVKYSFDLKFDTSGKKRIDSPDITDFYSLELKSLEDNSVLSLLQEVVDGEMLEIIKVESDYYLSEIKSSFKQEIEL